MDIQKINKELEEKTPQEILRWAINEFSPEVCVSTSFGSTSAVLLHMATQIKPDIRILFLETGFHFPETLEFKEHLKKLINLNNVEELKPLMGREEFTQKHGNLYETDPDKCCYLNKVEPLKKALNGVRGWITGIRRSQSDTREQVNVVESYESGIIKINPLCFWNGKQMWEYLKEHKLPYHPLFDEGFSSIGCAPCTRSVVPGEHERSGRWSGSTKKECGIHTFLAKKDPKPKE